MKKIIKCILVMIYILGIGVRGKAQVIDTVAFVERLSEAHKDNYIGYTFSKVLDSLQGLHIDNFFMSSPWNATDSIDHLNIVFSPIMNSEQIQQRSLKIDFRSPLPVNNTLRQMGDAYVNPHWTSAIANYLKDYVVDYIYVDGYIIDPEEEDLPAIRPVSLTAPDWQLRNQLGEMARKSASYIGQPFSGLWASLPAARRPRSVWGIGVPGVARERVTRFFYDAKDSLTGTYFDVKWHEPPLKSVTQQYEAATVRSFQYPRDYDLYKDLTVDSLAVHYTDSTPMPKDYFAEAMVNSLDYDSLQYTAPCLYNVVNRFRQESTLSDRLMMFVSRALTVGSDSVACYPLPISIKVGAAVGDPLQNRMYSTVLVKTPLPDGKYAYSGEIVIDSATSVTATKPYLAATACRAILDCYVRYMMDRYREEHTTAEFITFLKKLSVYMPYNVYGQILYEEFYNYPGAVMEDVSVIKAEASQFSSNFSNLLMLPFTGSADYDFYKRLAYIGTTDSEVYMWIYNIPMESNKASVHATLDNERTGNALSVGDKCN